MESATVEFVGGGGMFVDCKFLKVCGNVNEIP